ncbi:MAG: alpha-mannosidase [Clostridia bacterium]|nr:alpha-mannosidase [Clostridia bacterium]
MQNQYLKRKKGTAMPENRKFRERLDAWRNELKNQIIKPLIPVVFSGCATFDRLTPGAADRLPFAPMPVGTSWGRHREYCWFSADVTLPAGCEGQRIVLLSGVGGEQSVYMDGQALGSVDKEHDYVTLFRSAPANASFRLLIESYAGNGPRLENLGPCPPERTPIPPVTAPQCRVQESRLALFNEDAYQLFMDADTLTRLHDLLPDGSLRRSKIKEALDEFTHAVDLEAPAEERNAYYRKGREVLREALACRNGSTAPTLHLIGQSHLDLAWMWPMEETYHKSVRTYANQLALMEEYPEYRFLACEPALLSMLEESSPEVYARFLSRVKSGQVCADGAFYVECDTNIPSGESLVRQLLWGKKCFREKLGVESRVAWQPDTFGFSPCLPQLLRAFDVPYFATQKLLRADPECERFPYQDFIWEGADGSRVQALSFFKSNARTEPDSLLSRWEKDRSQREHINALLYPFGFGDGGGGATRDMLEYLRREQDLEGLPRTEWASLQEHFESAAENARKNLWRGELYLAWHRGAYTSQRKTKTAIRALEQALHDAEFLLSQCEEDARAKHRPLLSAAWKTLLLHQFHDICAGVGIRDVHEEAEKALTGALNAVQNIINETAREVYGIHDETEGYFTIVNTLPFARREWLTLPDGAAGYADLPASGALPVRAADLIRNGGAVQARPCKEGYAVNNGVLSFILRHDGTIENLTDLRTGLPLQKPGMRMNDLRLYRDVEPVYDAWELSPDYARDRLDAVHAQSLIISGENSPVFSAQVRYLIGQSVCDETITVRTGEPTIEFSLNIDWQERHKLLKAHFETNLNCENAIHELQFCHVERPAHRSTQFAKDRFEVCNHHYSALFEATRGVALLNRAVWGVSCEAGDVALTLLHAPCVPDDTCDRGQQRFSYALCVYNAPFSLSGVTRDGYAYNYPPLLLPGKGMNAEGIWAENALIETIKPAEEGNGTVIRLWETRGGAVRAILHLPHPRTICACGFDESNAVPLTVSDTYTFDLPAFGIRTMMLR